MYFLEKILIRLETAVETLCQRLVLWIRGELRQPADVHSRGLVEPRYERG